MNRRHFAILSPFLALAIILVIIGVVTGATTVKWVAPAVGLALISVGLGVNGLMIALQIDRRMGDIDTRLAQIENMQEEMRKELEEQPASGSTIVTSLQALSQHYSDLLSKQEPENEQDNEGGGK
jgi:hypothetical protein